MKKCNKLILIIGINVFLSIFSCGESERTEIIIARQTVGVEGGTVSGGNVTIEIPENGVSEETEIVITEVFNAPSGNLGPAYDLQPEGIIFENPVRITFSYLNIELPELFEEEELFIVYLQNGVWIGVDSSVDTLVKTVSAEVTHFSGWSIGDPSATSSSACNCSACTIDYCILGSMTSGGGTATNTTFQLNSSISFTKSDEPAQNSDFELRSGIVVSPPY